MDPDAHRDFLPRELLLNRDRRLYGGERAREHAHASVAEPLDHRSTECVVVAVERGDVELALLDAEALVRLEQRRVADHVGEHHCDEPAIEPLAHGSDHTALRQARSRH